MFFIVDYMHIFCNLYMEALLDADSSSCCSLVLALLQKASSLRVCVLHGMVGAEVPFVQGASRSELQRP